jgi:hypothetical protein
LVKKDETKPAGREPAGFDCVNNQTRLHTGGESFSIRERVRRERRQRLRNVNVSRKHLSEIGQRFGRQDQLCGYCPFPSRNANHERQPPAWA